MKEHPTVYDPNAHDRALVSLILSIVGLLLCGPFASIPAIVFAIKARRDGNKEAIGIVGFILGIIGLIIFIAAVIFLIIVFVTPDGTGEPLPTGGFMIP